MTNLDSILKSRDITLPTKVCLVKAMVFPVVMYGMRVGLWRKLSAKELVLFNCGVGEDCLRVPWTARRSNQSILKKSVLGVHLEGLMLKLKLQYFGHFMGRTDSLAKTLMLGGIGGRRRRGRQRMRWHHRLDGHGFEWTPGVCDEQGGLACCDDSWGHKELDTTERLNWTDCIQNVKPFLTSFNFSILHRSALS